MRHCSFIQNDNPLVRSSSKMMLGVLQLPSSERSKQYVWGMIKETRRLKPFYATSACASNNTLRSAYNNPLSTHTALGGHLVNGHYACHNCFNPYHLRFNRIVITLHLSSSLYLSGCRSFSVGTVQEVFLI